MALSMTANAQCTSLLMWAGDEVGDLGSRFGYFGYMF